VQCNESANGNEYDFNAGCNWGAAAPPPEASPAPVLRLAVQVYPGTRSGDEAAASLMLTNNGTVDLTNITVTGINVRILGGGDGSITQSLPISVENLVVTGSTTIPLTLKVPPLAKKVLVHYDEYRYNDGTV